MKKLRQWAYVKTCVERLNAVIEDRGKLVIQFKDEKPMLLVNQLVVAKNDRGCWEVRYPASERSTYRWYEHNPDYDHGYDWTLAEIYERLFSRIKVYVRAGVTVALTPEEWEVG